MKKIKTYLTKIIKKWKRMTKKKKVFFSAIAVVMVCVIVGSIIFIRKGQGEKLPQAVAQQATVTKGNISNTIVGTGNLETDASDSITVPSGITIKDVKVESGDAVSKGDTLATVDKTSVLEAIETVQEEIEELDEKINNCSSSDTTETITTKVSGKIKKIYAKKDDSVADCIAENGALIVIELDGGDKLKITASGGTVSKVHVSKKQEVSAGDTLLTITNDEESLEYKQLIAQRKELTTSLKKLTKMWKTGTIVADIDGTVGDVNVSAGSVDSGNSTSDSTTNKSVSASQMTYKTGSRTMQLKTKSQTEGTGVTLSTLNSTDAADTDSETKTTVTNNDTKIQLKIADSGSTTKNNLVLSVPKTGSTPQSEIKSSDNSYNGTIVWNPEDSAFEAGTTYSADVTLNAAEGFVFGTDSIIQIQAGLISGITVSDDKKTMSFKITFPSTTEKKENEQEEMTGNQGEGSKEQDTGSDNKGEKNSNTNTSDSLGSGNTPQSGSSSVKLSSSSASTESTSTDDSNSSAYSNEVTAFTLAPNDNMLLSVSVDELDINSVSKGQEAQITLDAIENKTFTGTVTKVGNSASSSGSGVAKYTVKIIISKDNQMKAGMNASATIVVENKENVLTIPVNALQERGNKVFVYTQQDDEGNLSGETEVTTGLSDGDNVEITEGLSEGDAVYYQKTGNISGGGTGGFTESGMPQEKSGNKGDNQEGFGGRGGSGDMPQGGPGQGGMQ